MDVYGYLIPIVKYVFSKIKKNRRKMNNYMDFYTIFCVIYIYIILNINYIPNNLSTVSPEFLVRSCIHCFNKKILLFHLSNIK